MMNSSEIHRKTRNKKEKRTKILFSDLEKIRTGYRPLAERGKDNWHESGGPVPADPLP